MSELKAISSGEIYNKIEYEGSCITDDLYYPKSEADKVLAEKDKVITYARALVREDIKLIRHQKYKRCLAMAERCKEKIENVVQYNEHDDWLIINEYWQRWQEHWLKIAENFKEA